MSLLNINRPIVDASIYEIEKPQIYLSENFTILLTIRGTVSCNEISCPGGEFLIVPPYTRLDLAPGEECALGCIRFSNHILLSVLDNADWFDKIYPSSNSIIMSGWSDTIENIILLSQSNTNASMANAFFTLIDMMNTFLPESEQPLAIELNEKGKEILSYIHQNITAQLTLNETAENVGLTPQYLSSFFQKYIGVTFKEYINRRKIDLCIPFFRYTDLTDSAIASTIGFASDISMQKAFYNITQKSTVDYRGESPKKFYYFPAENRVNNLSDYITPGHVTSLESSHYLNNNNIIRQQVYVDSIQKTTRFLPDSWRKILNIGVARHLTDPAFRDQLTRIQSRIEFTYGRILDLLDNTTIHEINGQIFYGYERIFTTLDLLLDLNLIPFIVIGNRFKKNASPTNDLGALSSSEDYQNYYKKLAKILPPFIRSCCNRYGVSEVARWNFEVCYEANSLSSNRQTVWNFCNTYSKIEATIHEYCPGCRIGGTGFNTAMPLREFEAMLKNLSSENIRVDFISFCAFNMEEAGGIVRLPKSGNVFMEHTSKALNLIKQFYPDLPVYISEFNICKNEHSFLNDYVFNACFILWFLIGNLDQVEGLGYSRLSDIGDDSSHVNELLYGAPGLYNIHGIRKPSYYSYRFFRELGPVISYSSNGVLITAKTRNSIQILMFHSPDLTEEGCIHFKNEKLLRSDSYTFEAIPSKSIETIINDVNPGNYLIKEYRINRNVGNILKEYANVQGIKNLSASDIECFQYLSNPSSKLSQCSVGLDGTLTLHTTILPLEIVMLQIDFNNPGDRNEI